MKKLYLGDGMNSIYEYLQTPNDQIPALKGPWYWELGYVKSRAMV